MTVNIWGVNTFANNKAASLLGDKSDELVGMPLETIIPERFRQRHVERSTAYLATPVDVDWQYCRVVDGQVLDFVLNDEEIRWLRNAWKEATGGH